MTGTGDMDGDGVDDLAMVTTADGQPGVLRVAHGGATLAPVAVAEVSPAATPALPVALIHSE